MHNIFKKRYSGQAIAIVMVVLVVATVLGASLYSRTLKNKEAAVNTKDSMMAVEQADSLLDIFVRADFQFLQDLSAAVRTAPLEFTRISDIKTFLDEKLVDNTILGSQENWCESTNNPASSLKLTIAPAISNEDFVDVRVGSTRVFNLQDNSYTSAPCNLTLYFKATEDSPTLFTIKEIYGNTSEIGEYVNDGSDDDMKAYCFMPDGSVCPDTLSSAAPRDSFLDMEAGNTLTVDLNRSRGGLQLYMIRIIPLNQTLAVAHSIIGDCSTLDFSYMKINAAVNCYGSFREKQIMVPGSDSLGYSSLFDYTIYNNGTLEPSN